MFPWMSLLKLVFLLFQLFSKASPSINPLAFNCNKSLQASPKTNTTALLQSLRPKLSKTNFSNATITAQNHSLTGFVQCRPDLSPVACSHCLSSAITSNICPESDTVMAWFDGCYLHYHPIFTQELQLFGNFSYGSDVWDRAAFVSGLDTLLLQLRAETRLESHHGFAAGEIYYGEDSRIYASAECLRYVTPEKCDTCLESGVKRVFECCDSKEGGVVIAGSCMVRFGTRPFLVRSPPVAGGLDSGEFISDYDGSKKDGSDVKMKLVCFLGVGCVCFTSLSLVVFLLRRRFESNKVGDLGAEKEEL